MRSGQPRQQHFVPRFYLEGFCDPLGERKGKTLLWVYEKNKEPRPSTPAREARERDYYTLKAAGPRDDSLEDRLGRIESAVAPIFRRLRDLAGHESNEPFTLEERQNLALFIGTLSTRTPAGRAILDTRAGPEADRLVREAAGRPERFRQLFESVCASDEVPENLEEIRTALIEGRVDLSEHGAFLSLASIASVGALSADILLRMNWQLVHAHEHEMFVTSDNPLVAVRFDERELAYFRMGVDAPGAQIYVPLTRKFCLWMSKTLDPGISIVPDRGVRILNKNAFITAYERAYAAENSMALHRLFQKRGCQVPIECVQPGTYEY